MCIRDRRTLALLQAELPLKKAAALAAEIHGVKKNALYKLSLIHILAVSGVIVGGLALLV